MGYGIPARDRGLMVLRKSSPLLSLPLLVYCRKSLLIMVMGLLMGVMDTYEPEYGPCLNSFRIHPEYMCESIPNSCANQWISPELSQDELVGL